tara:strand:- start:279 stop:500 length:222 start_codon:yes stop_codon:yes gene_type:complete
VNLDADQAMIIAGLAFGSIMLIGAIGCRIYEFFFPDKRPFPWEDEWGEEETPSEEEEVGSQLNDRSSNDSDTI